MAGAAVGVNREQGGLAVGDIGQVDTGIGAHEPVPRLGDDELVPLAQDPYALRQHQPAPGTGVFGVDGDQPALGLGDNLLGDDDYVVAPQGRAWQLGPGMSVGDIVAGAYLGQPLQGKTEITASAGRGGPSRSRWP